MPARAHSALPRIGAVGAQAGEIRRHRCGRCANPYTGGSEDCPNARRERPSQTIPYAEPGEIQPSPHRGWWPHVEPIPDEPETA